MNNQIKAMAPSVLQDAFNRQSLLREESLEGGRGTDQVVGSIKEISPASRGIDNSVYGQLARNLLGLSN